ncbi:MAG TPA: Lrp/AsnC family transcriptional regulator [Burkholderiaceae bacterium]|nr:Lrp/AsnC family transcriptional regulator [Burkholderiaceae bacterium]
MDPVDFRLVNDHQRGFPLEPRPYARIAAECGLTEQDVIGRLGALAERGVVGRIGAVFRPNTVGASTLAAITAPPQRLERIAERVSDSPRVNHNYERAHRLNLWFVVTAPDAATLDDELRDIEHRTGCDVLRLPIDCAYHVDLGFDLAHGARVDARVRRPQLPGAPRQPLSPAQRRLVGALEAGLGRVSRPYLALARAAAYPAHGAPSEREVIGQLEQWVADGTISRFGVIVRHRPLGFDANAMAVWDVPDHEVDRLGCALAASGRVTLCYRRRRALPQWRYNLYCMLHAKRRDEVRETLDALNRQLGLDRHPHAVLFRVREFKQTGASYAWRPRSRKAA